MLTTWEAVRVLKLSAFEDASSEAMPESRSGDAIACKGDCVLFFGVEDGEFVSLTDAATGVGFASVNAAKWVHLARSIQDVRNELRRDVVRGLAKFLAIAKDVSVVGMKLPRARFAESEALVEPSGDLLRQKFYELLLPAIASTGDGALDTTMIDAVVVALDGAPNRLDALLDNVQSGLLVAAEASHHTVTQVIRDNDDGASTAVIRVAVVASTESAVVLSAAAKVTATKNECGWSAGNDTYAVATGAAKSKSHGRIEFVAAEAGTLRYVDYALDVPGSASCLNIHFDILDARGREGLNIRLEITPALKLQASAVKDFTKVLHDVQEVRAERASLAPLPSPTLAAPAPAR